LLLMIRRLHRSVLLLFLERLNEAAQVGEIPI
jgi:hypothetical protein